MKLENVRVGIHRNSSDEVSIELTDRDSGTRFFRGVMTLEDFARAITGQSEVSIAGADLRGLDRLGMMMEVKTEKVDVPKNYAAYSSPDFAQDHAAWCAPFEVDGWQPDIDVRFNHHRSTGKTYLTHFRRWVRKTEEES
jgi:hypothetical protein